MSATTQALGAILGAINCRAMKIVELPESEREACHKLYWKSCYEAGLVAFGREALAKEQADRTERWIRARVRALETEGRTAVGRV